VPADLATQLASHEAAVVRAELGRNPAAAFLLQGTNPRSHRGAEGASARAGAALAEAPTPAPTPAATAVERSPARPPGGHRRRVGAGLALGLVLLGGSAVAWSSTLDTDSAQPSSTSHAVAWQGTWLPTGPDGPSDPSAATVSGFGHSDRGAAMAAAHLAVRIDPYAGPSAFAPTITTQTYGGDPDGLLASTEAAYRRAAAEADVPDGAPVPTAPGRILGWRTDGWRPDGPVTVHLLVATPSAEHVDFAIAVTWVDGDYRLVDPTRDDTFVTSPAADPSRYTSFSEDLS
jgi:hypothetical protein